MNEDSHFDRLLQAAAAEPEPQRLLFVFAAAELPEDATPAQRQNFAAGGGGTLTPLMCVDKGADEWASFDDLVPNRAGGTAMALVFAAGLSGRDGKPARAEQVEQAPRTMVERVRAGRWELVRSTGRRRLEFV